MNTDSKQKGTIYIIDIENLYPIYSSIVEICIENKSIVGSITSDILLVLVNDIITQVTYTMHNTEDSDTVGITEEGINTIFNLLYNYCDTSEQIDNCIYTLEANVCYVYDVLIDIGRGYLLDLLSFANGRYSIGFLNSSKKSILLTIDHCDIEKKDEEHV